MEDKDFNIVINPAILSDIKKVGHFTPETSCPDAKFFTLASPQEYQRTFNEGGYPDELIINIDVEYTTEEPGDDRAIAFGISAVAIWHSLQKYLVLGFMFIPCKFNLATLTDFSLKDFWLDQKKVALDTFVKMLFFCASGYTESHAIENIIGFIDSYDEEFKGQKTVVRIASDNVAVDIPWVDFLRKKHTKRPSFSYMKNGEAYDLWCRTVGFNPDDYYKGFLPPGQKWGFGSELAKMIGVHVPELPDEYKHLPHFDALHAGIEYAIISSRIQQFKDNRSLFVQ